jgi:hypothetical protein
MTGAANVSTDGAMVLLREEGWKEVKLCAISAVTVKAAGERAAQTERPSRRESDPLVELGQHSYQAGLWDADTMGQQQYAEGLRRGLDHCSRLSSVNDAAAWIERITGTNFPQAVQIVDWSHASGRVWTVAQEVLGAHTAQARQWAETQLDQLWQGQVESVVQALQHLNVGRQHYPPEVQQAPGYFQAHRNRMRYAQFRVEGYPIGSGTVESAANTVVHHRLRRPGRGWQRDAAQAMLAGLSQLHSGRFDQAWRATLPAAT